MGHLRPLFHLFSYFQTNTTIFTKNKCEKISIQYMVLKFEPTTFGTQVFSHNHSKRSSRERMSSDFIRHLNFHCQLFIGRLYSKLNNAMYILMKLFTVT